MPIGQRVGWGIVSLIMLGFAIYLFNIIGEGGLYFCGCPGLIILLWALFSSTRMKKVGDSYHFTCLLCGYRWEWREGQPWPKVQVNPELIAKGAQKLEEEEEAERRRQQEAALYYLSQQGKK